jgi:uncharacterized protein (DUF1810 family)
MTSLRHAPITARVNHCPVSTLTLIENLCGRAPYAFMTSDPFNLQRFVTAQGPVYATAVKELRDAYKRSHWMWFIFPQLRGLGFSSTAQFYGLTSLDEARAYLGHALLGGRLIECTQITVEARAASLHAMFGSPDDMKFGSSMTLFDMAAPNGVFAQALERWCDGRRDERTVALTMTAPV